MFPESKLQTGLEANSGKEIPDPNTSWSSFVSVKNVFSQNVTLDQIFAKSSKIYEVFSRHGFNALKDSVENKFWDIWIMCEYIAVIGLIESWAVNS